MNTAASLLPGIQSPELFELDADVPIRVLEMSKSVIYATDKDFRLIYANPSWDRFALENGAPQLVRALVQRLSIIDCVSELLRKFYESNFTTAIDKGRPFEHTFQCHSPVMRRSFHMRALPLRSKGLLIMNSLISEEPYADCGGRVCSTSLYLDGDRIISMCSHCRRTQHPGDGAWNWVPEFVRTQPEQTSHGLCPECLEYHYLREKRSR